MKVTKNMVTEKLQGLINFIENMQAITNNPYSNGLKTDELLTDIKAYIQETIENVELIEEVTEDSTEETKQEEKPKK